MDYTAKYLKYKAKYMELKKQYEVQQNTKYNMMGGSAGKNKLYLFKAEWCGHCKNFKSTWEKLQKEMNGHVEFVTYDADKHQKEISSFNIQGFPTLILKTNDKTIEFNGQRDMDSLKEFIQIYNE
jgi:thioredoxin-like negative regulator of GroEL